MTTIALSFSSLFFLALAVPQGGHLSQDEALFAGARPQSGSDTGIGVEEESVRGRSRRYLCLLGSGMSFALLTWSVPFMGADSCDCTDTCKAGGYALTQRTRTRCAARPRHKCIELTNPLEAFNISSCVRENTPDEVKHMLEGRTNATQALVSRFFQLSPSHYAKLEDPSYINYQSIQTEVR